MQIYSATFPVEEKLTPEELIRLVIEWNQGSQHNRIECLEWDGITKNVKFEEGNLFLAIEEIREYNTVAIRFHQLDRNNVLWNTDIVVNFNTHIFSIKLDRETTVDTISFVPEFKPPIIVNLLLDNGYVGADGDMQISDQPILINKDNYKIIENVICRKVTYSMPVVYVTKSWGRYPFRVKELSYRLRGVAHVLMEDDEKVSKILRDTCGGKNSHHGSVGIYYPSTSAANKIILTSNYAGRESILIDRIVAIVCRYVNQQTRDKMMTWEGVQNELLRLRYASATEKKEKAEDEVYAVYDSFGAELEEKEHTIEELNNRIMALQVENQGLRAKYEQVTEIPLLYYGVEDELYEGEIKDHILEALSVQLKSVKKKTRKEHILQDILECNEMHGSLYRKREEIKRILKGYTKVGETIKRELKDFGFDISKEGGHYKLVFRGDSRYLFTMAASGSDSQHGGGNLSAEIRSDLL